MPMSGSDASAEYREYENGVADVIAFLAAGFDVTRNVVLPGQLSGSSRQIDVFARGELLGKHHAELVVDCKRWKEPLDVADVGAFIDLAKDVGADFGLLVSLKGASKGAKRRATAEDVIFIRALSLDELGAWRPPGTVIDTVRIPASTGEKARRLLRHTGYRVAIGTGFPCPEGEQLLEVLRHYGTIEPGADAQSHQMADIKDKLASIAIASVHVAHGVVRGGGTPAHRWLQVRSNGETVGRVLASSDSELDEQLGRVAARSGLDSASLTVDVPTGWPVVGTFELGL